MVNIRRLVRLVCLTLLFFLVCHAYGVLKKKKSAASDVT